RARICKVDVPEVALERRELRMDELRRSRLSVEVVRRREEEALERKLLGPEARDALRLRRGEVPLRRDLGPHVPLVVRDARDRLNALRHLHAREALREHDAELVQLSRGRRRRRRMRTTAAGDDGEESYRREEPDHSR